MDEKLKERVRSAVRVFYIRLGWDNFLARECIDRGHMVIGHPEISHETALKVYEEVKDAVKDLIKDEIDRFSILDNAGLYAGQIMNFYTGGDYHSKGAGTGENTLWITYWEGHLLWTFAEGKAKPGNDLPSGFYKDAGLPSKPRDISKAPGGRWDYHWRETTGWRRETLTGDALAFANVDAGLVANLKRFQATICEVRDAPDGGALPYLKGLLLGEKD